MADADIRLEEIDGRIFRIPLTWEERRSTGVSVVRNEKRSGDANAYDCRMVMDASLLPDEDRTRLEKDFEVTLDVYKGSVVVHGPSREAVFNAQKELEELKNSKVAGKKSPFTHFVVVPFRAPWLQEKVSEFQEKLLREGLDNVDENVMENPERVCSVLCLLRLGSQSQLQLAKSTMREAGVEISNLRGNRTIAIKMSGLGVHPETQPRNATALYMNLSEASSDQKGFLKSAATSVYGALERAGLLNEQDMRQQRILRGGEISPDLIATLLTARAAGLKNLNLALVMDKMHATSFGNIAIEEILLAEIDSFDESGFYRSEYSIALQSNKY